MIQSPPDKKKSKPSGRKVATRSAPRPEAAPPGSATADAESAAGKPEDQQDWFIGYLPDRPTSYPNGPGFPNNHVDRDPGVVTNGISATRMTDAIRQLRAAAGSLRNYATAIDGAYSGSDKTTKSGPLPGSANAIEEHAADLWKRFREIVGDVSETVAKPPTTYTEKDGALLGSRFLKLVEGYGSDLSASELRDLQSALTYSGAGGPWGRAETNYWAAFYESLGSRGLEKVLGKLLDTAAPWDSGSAKAAGVVVDTIYSDMVRVLSRPDLFASARQLKDFVNRAPIEQIVPLMQAKFLSNSMVLSDEALGRIAARLLVDPASDDDLRYNLFLATGESVATLPRLDLLSELSKRGVGATASMFSVPTNASGEIADLRAAEVLRYLLESHSEQFGTVTLQILDSLFKDGIQGTQGQRQAAMNAFEILLGDKRLASDASKEGKRVLANAFQFLCGDPGAFEAFLRASASSIPGAFPNPAMTLRGAGLQMHKEDFEAFVRAVSSDGVAAHLLVDGVAVGTGEKFRIDRAAGGDVLAKTPDDRIAKLLGITLGSIVGGRNSDAEEKSRRIALVVRFVEVVATVAATVAGPEASTMKKVATLVSTGIGSDIAEGRITPKYPKNLLAVTPESSSAFGIALMAIIAFPSLSPSQQKKIKESLRGVDPNVDYVVVSEKRPDGSIVEGSFDASKLWTDPSAAAKITAITQAVNDGADLGKNYDDFGSKLAESFALAIGKKK